MAAQFYGTVLHDQGTFRMWYYACHRGMNPDWPPRKQQQVAKKPGWLKGIQEGFEVGQGPLCYAESDDGITWTKPALGQVLFKGTRDNNAIDLPHTIVSGAALITDEADPDPARRYKMVYQFFPDQSEPVIPEYGNLPSIACAVSPDGLRWTVTAMPFVNQSSSTARSSSMAGNTSSIRRSSPERNGAGSSRKGPPREGGLGSHMPPTISTAGLTSGRRRSPCRNRPIGTPGARAATE